MLICPDAINLINKFKEEVKVIVKKKCPESEETIVFPEDCGDCEYLKSSGGRLSVAHHLRKRSDGIYG